MSQNSNQSGATPPPFGCPRCDARWGGANTAHCSAEGCHRTFSGITAFDQHRAGSHARGRYCLDPETATFTRRDGTEWKLARLGRRYECWGFENDGYWGTDDS
jgi:hypothetical protein